MGDNGDKYLYHNSTLAFDIDTGRDRLVLPAHRGSLDLDHPFERLLIDTAVAPDPSQVSWISPNIQPGEHDASSPASRERQASSTRWTAKQGNPLGTTDSQSDSRRRHRWRDR